MKPESERRPAASARIALVGTVLAVLGVALVFLLRREPKRESAAPPPVPVIAAPALEPTRVAEPRSEPAEDERVVPAPIEPNPAPKAAPKLESPELSASEILVLRKLQPPGVVEVLVLAGRAPLPGARVDLRASSLGELPLDSTAVPEGAESKLTDAAGRATFQNIPPGEFLIGAHAGPGRFAQAAVTLDPERPQVDTVLISFGTGGMRGHVYRADGTPWNNALVYVTYAAQALRDMFVVDRADADGAYELGGLPSGTIWLVHNAGAEHEQDRVSNLQLALGEWKVIDLGSAHGTCAWDGVVRLANGDGLPEPGTLHLFQTGTNVRQSVHYQAGGSFSATFDRGSYALSIGTYSGLLELGEVSLELEHVQHDVEIPGIRVGGTLRYTGSWPDPTQPQGAAQVWLRNAAGIRALASQRDGSSYAFLALEPGSYTLSTYPQQIVGAPSGGVAIELSASQPSVTIDLEITDP